MVCWSVILSFLSFLSLLPTMSISVSSSFLPSSNVVAVKILPSVATGVRRPFHLTLLLDNSGSMDGPRINAVKRTLHLLVDAMADEDVLSIISYSHTSTIDANGTVLSVATRPVLHGIVDAMRADGGTNLESAFLSILGITEAPPIDAVFILTDGQVNEGIMGSAGLQRVLAGVIAPGTPIHTLGFGADHNIRLLRDIAMRSRGSYTYADADEMLPAIIGNIMGGLASEVGRNAILTIPDGWRCLELGAVAGDTQYMVGTLIAEKEQWVVLEAGESVPPVLEFRWTVGFEVHNIVYTIDDTIPGPVITEQMNRVRVASVFSQVTDILERGDIVHAQEVLTELGNYLDASIAKIRPFVIRLRAQVDEMLEAIQYPVRVPMLHGLDYEAGIPLAPMLSRMASNTSALGAQRGFFTSGGGGVDDTFSSPSQSRAAHDLTLGFTQEDPSCA